MRYAIAICLMLGACADEARTAQETRYLDALQHARTVVLSGGRLVLDGAGGELIFEGAS
jgi:heat shock protein HslJ